MNISKEDRAIIETAGIDVDQALATPQITGIGAITMEDYYPSIRPDGSEANFCDPDYWQHKQTRQRRILPITCTGNAVILESKIRAQTKHRALAVNYNCVHLQIDDPLTPEEIATLAYDLH
jgi:hypothetical protein